jgi:hypothetical protein
MDTHSSLRALQHISLPGLQLQADLKDNLDLKINILQIERKEKEASLISNDIFGLRNPLRYKTKTKLWPL